MKNKICHAYKVCGGCQYMGTAYPETLFEKRKYVQSLFPEQEVDMVIGMDDPYHYRNKVYATFGYDRNENLIAGMYEEYSHDIVTVPDCLIQNETANHIISSLTAIASQMHIEPYDEDTNTGSLRHAYIRVSQATGKALVVIVIGSKQLPGSKELVRELVKQNPEICSVVLNWNDKQTSMILGERDKILYGTGFVEDTIGGIVFRISAKSFYQVNPVQTEKLYSKAIELAQLDSNKTVLDACCGIGTISLFAAKQAKEVVGVEINESSIRDAIHNAEKNGIKNAGFYCDDARTFLERLMDTPDVVLLDPPRSGMGYHFMTSLSKMGPKRIVYVSCNPATQAEDISYLKDYTIEKIVPVDIFPWTKHVENIVLLTHAVKKNVRYKK
jgi:23S rRNA (uracil1939-C5)-methyltransferase